MQSFDVDDIVNGVSPHPDRDEVARQLMHVDNTPFPAQGDAVAPIVSARDGHWADRDTWKREGPDGEALR